MTKLTIDQALQQGIAAHKAGQLQEADRFYTAILRVQPKHPDANHNMGVLAVGVGKVEQALPFFKNALDADPATTQFWLSYIDALIILERLADAKAVLDQAKSKGAKGDGFGKLEKRLQKAHKEPFDASRVGSKSQPQQPNTLDSLKLDQALRLAKKKVEAGSTEEANHIYRDILAKFPQNKRARDGIKRLENVTIGTISKVQDPPQSQQQSIINLYSQGQLEEALNQVTELLQNFPNSSILFNIFGIIHLGLGHLDAAITAYSKALVIKPDNVDAYNNMGNTLKEQGKLEEALEAYNKALAIKPNFTEAYSNMANTLKDQGKLEEAVDVYIKILDFKPDYVEAYFNMGNTLKDQGKLEEAIKTYNKALSIKPDYAEAHNNMGVSLQQHGELEKAEDAYNKALAIKPDFVDACNNLGNVLKDQGRLEESIKVYTRVLELKPDDAAAYSNMGVAFKKQGKPEKAIEAYTKALAIQPNFAEAYNNMGVTLQERGDLEESIKAYTKAMAAKPDNVEAHYNVGNALRDQGKLEEAIEAYTKALAINPEYVEAYNNMGNVLQECGELEEVIETYNKALSIKPDYVDAWVNGAEILEKWNQTEQLDVWLGKAFEVFDIVPSDLRFMKAKLFWRNEEFKAASNLLADIDFETIQEKRKQDYLVLKAKCYEKNNDFDNAYECFFKNSFLKKTSSDYEKYKPEIYFQGLESTLTKLKAGAIQTPIHHSKKETDFVPVFLVGFPRSGTTLLDTILRSHSKIEVVEEQPALSAAKALLENGGYNDLANNIAPPKLLTEARKSYELEFHQHIDGVFSEFVYIDKLPLNLLEVPLIFQLYPKAKFILALRHPMDSILSCWMQNFKLNPAMANMVDLDRIVEFYCLAMEVFKICRANYDLSVHEIRYEDLLEDLNGETSMLLRFLNLDWEPQINYYKETALKRGRIKTPSYSQVVQPIYKDAKYRWLNYKKYLDHYLEDVGPWISRFRYGEH